MSVLITILSLVFALSMGELGATHLVVPPGYDMLSVRIFTLIHYSVYPDVAAFCLLLLAFIAGCAGGLLVVYRLVRGRVWWGWP